MDDTGKPAKPKYTVSFDYSTPPTLNHVAAIYGMSGRQLVRAIRENKDGKYDRLYVPSQSAAVTAK